MQLPLDKSFAMRRVQWIRFAQSLLRCTFLHIRHIGSDWLAMLRGEGRATFGGCVRPIL
jgi:hypothetical protein